MITFVNVLEEILKQMRRIHDLEVKMILKFTKKKKAMRNNHFIITFPLPIVGLAFDINRCIFLQWMGIVKATNMFAFLINMLTVFRWFSG